MGARKGLYSVIPIDNTDLTIVDSRLASCLRYYVLSLGGVEPARQSARCFGSVLAEQRALKQRGRTGGRSWHFHVFSLPPAGRGRARRYRVEPAVRGTRWEHGRLPDVVEVDEHFLASVVRDRICGLVVVRVTMSRCRPIAPTLRNHVIPHIHILCLRKGSPSQLNLLFLKIVVILCFN